MNKENVVTIRRLGQKKKWNQIACANQIDEKKLCCRQQTRETKWKETHPLNREWKYERQETPVTATKFLFVFGFSIPFSSFISFRLFVIH